jgi:biotin-(acetyl-CoA carboxylase) ligase
MNSRNPNPGIFLTDDPTWAAAAWGAEGPAEPTGMEAAAWWDVLAPGVLPRALAEPGLGSGWGGHPLHVLALARAPRSQYRVVRERLNAGAVLDRPLVCLAGAGDRFEGQGGRTWRALAGNLHLTLAVPCDLPAGRETLALTALPAVAVRRALDRLRPADDLPPAGIKWVNDVLIRGRKVAGVLTSVRTQEGRVTAAVFGIGLNVGAAPELPPSVFTPGAASLRSAWGEGAPGLGPTLRAVLAQMFAGLAALATEGPGPVMEAYREGSMLPGRRVAIWPPRTADSPSPPQPPAAEGVVAGIGPDLGLRLAGRRESIRDGRLAVLGPA